MNKTNNNQTIEVGKFYKCLKHYSVLAVRNPKYAKGGKCYYGIGLMIMAMSTLGLDRTIEYTNNSGTYLWYIKPYEPFLVLNINKGVVKLLCQSGIVWTNYNKTFSEKRGFICVAIK